MQVNLFSLQTIFERVGPPYNKIVRNAYIFCFNQIINAKSLNVLWLMRTTQGLRVPPYLYVEQPQLHDQLCKLYMFN